MLAAQDGANSDKRKEQMAKILAAVQKVRKGDDSIPVIVMGDLNDIFAPLETAFDVMRLKPSHVQMDPPYSKP